MTWTRLSDDFADHPDLLAADRSARLLHVEALVYCNRHGNDGRFRRSLVPRMTDAADWSDLVDELLKLGVWTDTNDGFLSIDWKAWEQEPAAAVRERREAHAEASKAYRERGTRHRAGDHSMCTTRCPDKTRDQSRDGSRDGSRDASRDPLPSRPVPSRPLGRDGEGKGQSATPAARRSAGAPHLTAVEPPERTGGTSPPQAGANPWQLGIAPTIDGQPVE